MSKNKHRVSIFTDAVALRGTNKLIVIQKNNQKDVIGKNLIMFKTLTSIVTTNPGVKHVLSDNEKIKYSFVGLSDEAIKDLYAALHHYIHTNRIWQTEEDNKF